MSNPTGIPTVPHESHLNIFRRFLKFGLLAWGGPVAQIAMIQHELVVEEKWIDQARFNRVLAVYQALPGPEAHELCVYFGMQARGRSGALLAGLGFMLPGFVLMFALSWFYVTYGINSTTFQAIFLGMQPAVSAQIVRAVLRISGQALQRDAWLWIIAVAAGLAHLTHVNFLVILLFGGSVFALVKQGYLSYGVALVLLFTVLLVLLNLKVIASPLDLADPASSVNPFRGPSASSLLATGLRSGLLTFGGAYTAIPIMEQDAVQTGAWMTRAEFLDGLALSSLLPAPLIIFSTFVGYLGGGPVGALLVTLGVFAPAFAFTLFGHEYLERLITNSSIHHFLDGVTGSVVGLIAATALGIIVEVVHGYHAWLVFGMALLVLVISKSKWTIAIVILAAGGYGLFFLQ